MSQKGAEIFGELKSAYRHRLEKDRNLKKKEMEKHLDYHSIDLIIASSALEQGTILVSNDSIFTIFEEIYPDLKVENWTVVSD